MSRFSSTDSIFEDERIDSGKKFILTESKNTHMDISIVIVNYNVKDFLYQCLKSIERGSAHLSVEIYVVDNNSTDGSMELLPKQFPHVNFIALDENIGFGKANNLAIHKATGKYILLLNPDTVLSEHTLERMVSFMESDPSVGIAGCKVLNEDGSFQSPCRRGFPTPWASLCKLFFLEKLFPHSPLFARYSQTFRDENATYYIDAISGSFMFCRRDTLRSLNGFDPDFHMYAEDIDLCYRAYQCGWKTAYYHETTIIHYQGKSTKRSSMNEVKVFYQAMEIFARKHYASSLWFLSILKLGIRVRALIAILMKNKRSISAILWDAFAVNASILLATPFRFRTYFGLPDYAYPTVFMVTSCIVFLSHFFSGTYFEGKSLVRRAVVGYAIAFFVLSSLTYFVNDYAFSRGVLLLTIAIAVMISTIGRMFIAAYEKVQGNESEKHIAILGTNDHAGVIINTLLAHESQRAHIVGVIAATDNYHQESFAGLPVLGKMSYIRKIVDEHLLDEIIVTDHTIDTSSIIHLAMQLSAEDIRLHIADDYDGVITARIVNSITGIEATVPIHKAHLLRHRVVKRLFDIVLSTFLLTLGSPIVFLFAIHKRKALRKLWEVLGGAKSIVGIYSRNSTYSSIVKTGITGLAHLSRPELLSDNALQHLNTYYIQNYSPALDIEILLRFFFRRKRGK